VVDTSAAVLRGVDVHAVRPLGELAQLRVDDELVEMRGTFFALRVQRAVKSPCVGGFQAGAKTRSVALIPAIWRFFEQLSRKWEHRRGLLAPPVGFEVGIPRSAPGVAATANRSDFERIPIVAVIVDFGLSGTVHARSFIRWP
jgi:hypothetical protein